MPGVVGSDGEIGRFDEVGKGGEAERLEQSLLRRVAPVEAGDADAGPAGDLADRSVRAEIGHPLAGGQEHDPIVTSRLPPTSTAGRVVGGGTDGHDV